MSGEIIKDIITGGNEAVFQIRLLKDEEIGLLTTKTNKNYLILDSIDF
jgi:hypothetical protein